MIMPNTPLESYILPHDFETALGTTYLKSFKCFHLNVQSVTSKESNLISLLQQVGHDFDVIMLSETWSTDETNVFRLPAYQTFYINRTCSRGGGVCILVKEGFNCELIEEFCVVKNDYEFLCVKVNGMILAVCYRPPSGVIPPFLDFLELFLDFVGRNRFDVILGGDLNINMIGHNSTQTKLDLLLTSSGLSNVINLPTRITQTSSSLIDLFITNLSPDKLRSGVIAAEISDHLPIFVCSLKNMPPKKHQRTHPFQFINETKSLYSAKKFRVQFGRAYFEKVMQTGRMTNS